MRYLLSSLLLLSPLLPATPPPEGIARIPFDPRPFRVVLEPMQEMTLAGSIVVRNASDLPLVAKVRFILSGGWFLEIGVNDQELCFAEHVQRGSIATVSAGGVHIGLPAPEVPL